MATSDISSSRGAEVRLHARHQQAVDTQAGEFVEGLGRRLRGRRADGQLQRVAIPAGGLGLDAQARQGVGELGAPQPQGLPAVAAPSGATDGGRAVAPDVNGHAAGSDGLGVGMRVGEGEELTFEGGPLGLGVGPQGAHDVDALVGAPAPTGEVDSARLELLTHPPHPDAQPHPALAQPVHRGQALGHDHGMVRRQHEHAGGELERGGDTGQKSQQVDGIGDGAVVGQRHAPRRRVRIATGVVADDEGVLHHDDGLEAQRLDVLGEARHPVGIGTHPGPHGREGRHLDRGQFLRPP